MNQLFDTKLYYTKQVETGLVEEDDDTYHATRPILSSGGIRKLIESPKKFHAEYICGIKSKPTKAMEFGTIVHKILLQGSKYRDLVRVKPDFGDLRNKANKERSNDWINDQPFGAIFLTEEEDYLVKSMIEGILFHPRAKHYLKNGMPEMSGYFMKNGIQCKIKPDFINSKGLLVDLKTTIRSDERSFSAQAWREGYHIQAAFYLMGMEEITGRKHELFSIIAVEKSYPSEVTVCDISEFTLEQARADIEMAFTRLKNCIDSNEWPGYKKNTFELMPPRWAEFEEREEA